jgi:hypothetical protein
MSTDNKKPTLSESETMLSWEPLNNSPWMLRGFLTKVPTTTLFLIQKSDGDNVNLIGAFVPDYVEEGADTDSTPMAFAKSLAEKYTAEWIAKLSAPFHAELAELRRDKERLDWLQKEKRSLFFWSDNTWSVLYNRGQCTTAREAIDAEMKENAE